jgi:hypothetical protein
VTWSPGDVDVGIQSLLIQIYPILLSTLLSINRQQLSTSDARFCARSHFIPSHDIPGIRLYLRPFWNPYRSLQADQILSPHHPYPRSLSSTPLDWTKHGPNISPRAFKDSSCEALVFLGWFGNTIALY